MNNYLKQMEQSLEELKKERPKIAQYIQEARSLGDLSENAEYDDARNKQAVLESKIKNLETRLILLRKEKAETDEDELNSVRVGSTVMFDMNGKKIKVTIVPTQGGDPDNNIIALDSPLGAGLLGKKKGEETTIDLPAGTQKIHIKKIT